MSDATPSAGGSEKLPVWEPTRENFADLLQTPEYQNVISSRETLAQNQATVMEKLKLLLTMCNGLPDGEAKIQAGDLVREYIDELAASMNARLQAEGEKVREGFLALSATATAQIEEAMKKARGDKESPAWVEANDALFQRIIGRFSPPASMPDGKLEESYLSPDIWQKRISIDGRLVQEDWDALQKIKPPDGTAAHAAFEAMRGNLQQLQVIDSNNFTFIRSTPALRPGVRFALSFLLAGAALVSFLIATKTKRLPKKGLLALGLLLYLNRNRASPLSFLSGPRYAALTRELRGDAAGKEVFEKLGNKDNRTAIKEFVARERKRFSLPVHAREGFSNASESYATLMEALGIDPESSAGKRLRKMPPNDIAELSSAIHKFTPEEMEIAVQLVRRDVDVARDVGTIPVKDASPEIA